MKLKIIYLLSNTFFISLFNKGMGFISILILYKFFDKAMVGEFNIYVTYVSLFITISLLGSEQSLLKKLLHTDKNFNDYFSTYFFLIVSLYCLTGIVLYCLDVNIYLQIVFIFFSIYLIVEKFYEMYSKYKNKYNSFLKSQSIIIFTGILLYIAYPILFKYFNEMMYLIIVKIFGLFVILYITFEFIKKIPNLLDFTNIVKKIKISLKNDKEFILLLLVSNVVVYSDKIIISSLVDYKNFADFSLLMSFVGLVYSMKILFSNKYLYSIKKSTYYIKKTRLDSMRYTSLMGIITFTVYYLVTEFYLLNYSFLYIPFLFSFIFIFIESSFGAAGPVITYMHKPIVNMYFELFSLILILILLFVYTVFLNQIVSEVTFFVVSTFFVKSVMSYLKLNFIKKRKLIN